MTQWNAKLYDSKHQFVSNYGEGLISLLNPLEGERILDVGCGTGDLAQQIASYHTQVVGIDAAPTMIEQAKVKYPHLNFEVADVTALSYNNAFDAIFSNAALHWVKPQTLAIQSMYNALKKGGRLVVEMGGHGNIQSITTALKQAMNALNFAYDEEAFPWFFPTVAEYTKLLDAQGFSVQYIELYERPTELHGEDGVKNWLKMFSGSLLKHLNETEKEQVYTEAENRLREHLFIDGKWVADYCRLRFTAYK